MSPERWRRVEDVYHAALGRPTAERHGFLAETCRDDADLCVQVEALIRRTESGSPLDQPVCKIFESCELPANRQLGPYRILAHIGTGGMGRVYKALDTRLGRTVALKVSKSQFSDHFQREARAISALNHPNICTLYDVGPEYLVMEYVEGSPLRGPLPIDQALHVASAVAGALDSAHRQGIVHRDLKPANILLTRSGPKLLDFGLARQIGLPDDTVTHEESIAGTPAYMAPEQLQGRKADARSDIFAFGVVLYELLTGHRAFAAGDSASLIAAILTAQLTSVRDYLAQVPPALERCLDRCLAKDPDDRWQSAADLKAELDWIAASPAMPGAPIQPTRARRRVVWIGLAAAALLVIVAGALWLRDERTRPAPLIRFAVDPPPGELFFPTFPLLSPDGQKLLFATRSSENAKLIPWIHRISTGESTSLTVPGLPVTWSPDSVSVALAGEDGLTRTDLVTGARTEITREPVANFAWGPGDSYLVTIKKKGVFLWSNGRRTLVGPTGTDQSSGPFLPGARSYLFWKVSGTSVETWMAQFDGTPPKLLVPYFARYAPPGYLLYARASVLVAQRFDAARGELTGEPQALVSGVGHSETTDPPVGLFSVSQNGVLAYLRDAPRPAMRLIWFDRAGNPTGSVGDPGDYSNPALSPDGQRLAVCIRSAADQRDIWVIDLDRGGRTRLTFAAPENTNPTWSADGSRILYSAYRNGRRSLYTRNSAGTGEERLLLESDKDTNPLDWSRDGKVVLYNSTSEMTGRELKTLPVAGEPRTSSPFLASPFRVDWAAFSPDGRWVLYRSFENGHAEIFMQPFPPDGRKWPISGGASTEAQWRGDSREIYYPSNAAMMALEVRTAGAQVTFGKTRELFRLPPMRDFGRNSFAVSRDGQRFLMATTQPAAPIPIMVVVNWPRLLEPVNGGRGPGL